MFEPFLKCIYYVLAVCLIVDNILYLDVHYKCALRLFNTLSCRVGALQIPIIIIIAVLLFCVCSEFYLFSVLIEQYFITFVAVCIMVKLFTVICMYVNINY